MTTVERLIVGEGNWLPLAMLIAAILAADALRREGPTQARVLAAMYRFFGATIGTMTIGHLLAVTVKASQGTLNASPWVLYPLGLGLTIPSWWLVAHARDERGDGRAVTAVNAGLGIALVAIGLVNIPLAVPAALNLGYRFHRRPATGKAIVVLAVVTNILLFVGGVIFMASGQTFEEFSR